MGLTYDEIYGCTLEEYLKYHNKNKEDLEKELEKDIELLRINYMKYANNKFNLSEIDIQKGIYISKYIEKKRNHLKRIKDWRK